MSQYDDENTEFLQIGIAPKNPAGLTYSKQVTQDDGDVVVIIDNKDSTDHTKIIDNTTSQTPEVSGGMSGGSIALIIIFLLIAIGVGIFFGYRYYKKKFQPNTDIKNDENLIP